MIISHNHPKYKEIENRINGAYWYSYEIVKNIIPRVVTDRNWITINIPGAGADHSIVFIHNNLKFNQYEWLADYKDLILVCSQRKTLYKVHHLGTPVYLPLSIDINYVKQFYQAARDIDTAYVGRREKLKNIAMPKGIHYICNCKRRRMLAELGRCSRVYAIGRCAIEAKCLGVEVLPYDPRYPDPSIWEVKDNKEGAKLLQRLIDREDLNDRK